MEEAHIHNGCAVSAFAAVEQPNQSLEHEVDLEIACGRSSVRKVWFRCSSLCFARNEMPPAEG